MPLYVQEVYGELRHGVVGSGAAAHTADVVLFGRSSGLTDIWQDVMQMVLW